MAMGGGRTIYFPDPVCAFGQARHKLRAGVNIDFVAVDYSLFSLQLTRS